MTEDEFKEEWPDDFDGAVSMVNQFLIERMKKNADDFKDNGPHGSEAVATFMANEASLGIYAAFTLGVMWRTMFPNSRVKLHP